VAANVSADAGAGKLVGRELQAYAETSSGLVSGMAGMSLEADAGGAGKGSKATGKKAVKGVAGEPAAEGGTWDQFTENERLFGIKASFPEHLYTSKLDKSSFTAEQLAAADAIAAEILAESADSAVVREDRDEGGPAAPGGKKGGAKASGKGKTSTAEDDEEARYSSVARPAGGSGGAAPSGDAFTDAGVAQKTAKGAKRGGGSKQ
jgi:hypothetical protein